MNLISYSTGSMSLRNNRQRGNARQLLDEVFGSLHAAAAYARAQRSSLGSLLLTVLRHTHLNGLCYISNVTLGRAE